MTARRPRLAAVALALGVAAAPPAAAPAADLEALVEPRAPALESVTPTGYRVRVFAGEPRVLHGLAHGMPFDEVTVADGRFEAPAGTPQIPALRLYLRVPWGATPRVEVASVSHAAPVGPIRPVPVPYLLSEPAVLDRVSAGALSGLAANEGYFEGGGPGDPAGGLVRRSVLTAAGEERLLEVWLTPLRWDPRTGMLSAARELRVDVTWDAPAAALAEPEARSGSLSPPEAVGPRYAARPPRARGLSGAPGAAAREGPSRAGALAPAYAGPMRVGPGREWVRLGVVRSGLYALSPADLAAAGVAPAGIEPTTIRIFRAAPGDLPESMDVDLGPDSLRECAIAVDEAAANGVFDGSDRVYFYATGNSGFGVDLARGGGEDYQESQRSGEESLWLTWGPALGLPPPQRLASRGATPGVAPLLTAVTHRVHYEENRINDFNKLQAVLRWERWFQRAISQGSRIRFTLDLPGAPAGGAASLFVRMWGNGLSLGATVPDHITNLYWNQALIASASWDFSFARDVTAAGVAVHVRDTLDIEVPRIQDPGDPGRFDQSYLAWFEVRYPRRLAAILDTLQFVAPDSTIAGRVGYAISGVSDTTAAWLLDRTDPERPVRLASGVWSGAGPFTLTVEDSVGPGYRPRYALVSKLRAPRPATVVRYAPVSAPHALVDLLDPANGADYLVIAPGAFLTAAESLAAYRSIRLHGFPAPRVAIATMERVTAQLGGGKPDPVAVRNLLAYARAHWSPPAPSYVCLLGDASLDPRNYLGFGSPDLVPTHANQFDTNTQSQFITDDWLGLLDGPGDQLLDIAVGRLPARTAAEAVSLVRGKIQAYEGATDLDPWRARALLCADDSWKREQRDGLGNDHVRQMERKDRQHLPVPLGRSKVYLNDYAFADTTHQSKPAARADLIARINQGNWLVDYIGHGSDQVLADEQVFRAVDVAQLSNGARPSIFGFFSCTVGKFDALGQEGMAELLLKHPTGGAVATLAATQEAFGSLSTRLNDAFVDQLFPLRPRVDSTVTVGFATARAKNANVSANTRKYALLGDPALLLPIPRGRGVWEKGPLDSLLRGEVAAIRGHALKADSTADTTAAGTVMVEALGPPIRRVQVGLNALGGLEPFGYEVPGPVLFRGEVPLDRGAFEARFVVPMDGRIVGTGARLQALLSSAGGRGAGLAFDSIRIGASTAPRVDLTPPEITLRYPAGSDSTVAPGGRVTVVIEDSSGVDLLRLDNAHTIFAIFDDQGIPLELTPGFRYEPGSFTRGSVELTIPALAEGVHRLEVRASDTYGNIGSATFLLDVVALAGPGDPIRLTEVFNYPNPFERETYLHARLNQPARLTIQIFTVAGRRVRDLRTDGSAGENYVPWDGRDSRGENVANGVYLIKIVAESLAGNRASAMGRALRAR